MNEEIVIKREWVKKAGIIFIIIVLLLTFFSNTIMNASMPEVFAKSIEAGKIQVSISGSGTAKAISTYQVMISQTRTIKNVLIQPGTCVNVGDVLFELEEEESDELKTALDAADDLNFQYQKMLLNLSAPDYTAHDRGIASARKALDEAMEKHEANKVSRTELSSAEAAFHAHKQKVTELSKNITELQEEVGSYASATDEALNSLKQQIEDKTRQLINISSNRPTNPVSLSSLRLELKRLKEDYDLLVAKYPDYRTVSDELEVKKVQLQNAQKALSDAQSKHASQTEIDNLRSQVSSLESAVNGLKNKLSSYSEFTNMLRQIEDKEREIANYKLYPEDNSSNITQTFVELNRLKEEYNNMIQKNKKYHDITNEIKSLKDELANENESLEISQNKYNELNSKYEKWESGESEVKSLQNNLEDLLFAFEEKKKEDQKTSALNDLDYNKLKKDIEKQNTLVEKLHSDAVDGKIVAQRSGIIQSINIAAGGTTAPNTPIAVIETTDKGYALSFIVSKEQSEKVAVGDTAMVDDSNVTAKLLQITNDTENPGEGTSENKVLTFLLGGEIKSGGQYSLNISKEGKNYDIMVPKSAIHSDSSGYFVLTIKSKKTPFGARYMTQRVSIKVEEQDEQNCGVSGSLKESDSVITTSSKPLEPGMQIRMSNEQGAEETK